MISEVGAARIVAWACIRYLELEDFSMDVGSWNTRNWLQRYWLDASSGGDSVPSGLTPIVIAAYFKLHETVTGFLWNIGPSDPSLDRALFFACQRGHLQVLTLLLRSGADPNAEGTDCDKPITTAAEHGHLDCVVALEEDERIDLNGRDGGLGRTALSFACSNGHGNMVKELLERGQCRVDRPDYTGSTPFMSAVRGGHARIVNMLVKRSDVDVNHRDNRGRTAVSHAAESGTDKVVRIFLNQQRVDPNLAQSRRVDKASVDRDRRGAISWACGGGHLSTLQILLRHGCPGIDTRDVDDWTPLAWAVQLNRPGIVETLVATGEVDIEGRDGSGVTALFWVVSYGHLPVVRALLQAGANPVATNNAGRTPAEIVASIPGGREEVVAELNRYIRADGPAGSS